MKLFSTSYSTGDTTQIIFLHIFRAISWTAYILLAFGYWTKKPGVILNLQAAVHLYIGLYLLYRFNDFRQKVVFTELDRMMCAFAGAFLFISTVLGQFLLDRVSEFGNRIGRAVHMNKSTNGSSLSGSSLSGSLQKN